MNDLSLDVSGRQMNPVRDVNASPSQELRTGVCPRISRQGELEGPDTFDVVTAAWVRRAKKKYPKQMDGSIEGMLRACMTERHIKSFPLTGARLQNWKQKKKVNIMVKSTLYYCWTI